MAPIRFFTFRECLHLFGLQGLVACLFLQTMKNSLRGLQGPRIVNKLEDDMHLGQIEASKIGGLTLIENWRYPEALSRKQS